MATWIKYSDHQKRTVFLNLDAITSAIVEDGSKIVVSYSSGYINIHKNTSPDAYQKVLNYLEQNTGQTSYKPKEGRA